MKVLRCEMCGNTGLVKKDGVYVCEACGTKYTQEEAKKMLVEGAVSVKGAVKIDKMTEEQNLIILARRAYKNGFNEEAGDLYARALEINPNNWESVFFKSATGNGGYYPSKPALILSLNLIKTTIKDKDEQMKAFYTIVDSAFMELNKTSLYPLLRSQFMFESLLLICDNVSEIDESYNIVIWKGIVKGAIRILNEWHYDQKSLDVGNKLYNWIPELIAKIRKFEPDYVPEEQAKVPRIKEMTNQERWDRWRRDVVDIPSLPAPPEPEMSRPNVILLIIIIVVILTLIFV